MKMTTGSKAACVAFQWIAILAFVALCRDLPVAKHWVLQSVQGIVTLGLLVYIGLMEAIRRGPEW